MITNFKLFENLATEAKDLIEQLDETDIDNIYNKNHKMCADDILSNWPDSIWNFIDDEKFINDFIKDEVNSRELSDFEKHEFENYIEENLTDDIKSQILDLYNKNNDEQEEEFDDYMIEELDEDDLKDIIEDNNKESEFIENIVRGWYDSYDAKEFFKEFYGYDSFDEIYNKNSFYTNKESPHEIVNKYLSRFKKYVDIEKLENSYLDEDYYTKVTELVDDIPYDKELQTKILNANKENVLLLSDLMEESLPNDIPDRSIGKKYFFQKAYIEEYLKDYISGNEEDYTEEEKSDIIAKSLKFLNDKFGINSKIEKEYENEMWIISSDRYNL